MFFHLKIPAYVEKNPAKVIVCARNIYGNLYFQRGKKTEIKGERNPSDTKANKTA